MRVAIVHDWLVAPDGAQTVLEQLIHCYPDADLFSLVDFLEDRRPLGGKPVKTSFLQRLPFARRRYRAYWPWVSLALGQFDLSAYDLIITTSDALAPGVICGPNQLHVNYAHSPARHAWDRQHEYLREAGLTHGPRSWIARVAFHCLRGWHADSAQGVDRLIVNSRFAARRLMKTQRRAAAVIAPPVDVKAFRLCTRKEDFFVAVSRAVPHQRIDLIVDAFNSTPHRRLVVIGDAARMAALRAKAGPNVTMLGEQSRDVLKDYLQRARALVFAAEDFDPVLLEAQACGTPVITFGRGGALETVVPLGDAGPSGVYFGQPTVGSLVGAIERFEQNREWLTPAACRANAERFSAAVFRRAFMLEMTRTIAATGLRPATPESAESDTRGNGRVHRPVAQAHKGGPEF
ncbi:glycosyltransferase [Paraburkholderia sp. PREW-6R]|uniref:glycosyltransferase n=1 Tax=Paraburkholderia sp. PREW-6R TaxID=3141544 RepID=UPI0031F58887